MTKASREQLRLRAVGQLRQAGRFISKNPQPEVIPIPVQQRAEAHLWGKIPTQAMLVLREQPDKTVRVYSALCTLLQGKARTVQVAEIAYLSLLKDRAAREHLKRLKEVGLIGYKASMHGPSIYWLTSPCAGNDCVEETDLKLVDKAQPCDELFLPDRFGGELPPNKDKILEIKPLTPWVGINFKEEKTDTGTNQASNKHDAKEAPLFPSLEPTYQASPTKEGRGVSHKPQELKKQEANSDHIYLEPTEYLEQRKSHKEKIRLFLGVCEQVKTEIEADQTSQAQNAAVERAVKEGKIPDWWVEMIDFLPLSKTSQSILMEAVPRERNEDFLSLGMPRFFAGLAKQRQEDLEAAFSQLHQKDISLMITGDKSDAEISIADINSNIKAPKIDGDQVSQIALKRLGWETELQFEEMECIERYDDQAKEVIELAKKAGEGNTLGILDQWTEYPVKAILRLVELEKEKSMSEDPVRKHNRWWKKTLCGIVEKQREEDLRRNRFLAD